jgi:hypothetical protein
MVPVITEGGRSFKGAALYFLHDKRQAGEAERLTVDRVAWSEVVNLPTNDPERAWRMMVHTAMAQADLKAAAGTKATGRKLTKPVFAYSLAWHETDKPTKEDQLQAARQTLKELGLSDRQALIVCHNDTKHPHVHLIVNRVDPATGIAAPLSKSKEKLQAWALQYQRERGQTHCPKREEKAQNREQGEKIDRTPRKSRTAHEFDKATGNDNLAAHFVKADQEQQDAQLLSVGRAMKESHARQWTEIKRVYAVAKSQLYDHADQRKQQEADRIKEDAKPRWRALFQRHRIEAQQFEARETGLLTTIFNVATTLRTMSQEGTLDGITALAVIFSGRQRRSALARAHEAERRDLAREIKNEIRDAGRQIQRETQRDAGKLRGSFLEQCAALRATQDRQAGEMRAAWQTRNAERKAALAPAQERTASQAQQRTQGRTRSRSAEQRRLGGFRSRFGP